MESDRLSKKREVTECLSSVMDVLHYIQKWGKVIIRSIITVNAVVYCKKTDIFLCEQNFRIKADLQIVSS